MNPLAQELVKEILGENTSSQKKIVGMFGGGFKPPTSGHLEVVKKALQENPEMDALIILVGSGTRDSISQEESLAIWNIYKKSLPSKVVVMASPANKPPIGAIYSYAKKNPNKEIYWFIGEREGNKDDFYDFTKRTRALRSGNYTNIQSKKITTADSVSGTKARKALLAQNKEEFSQYLPNIPEIDEIWNLLTAKEKDEVELNERIVYDVETRMQTRFLMKQFLKTIGTKVEDSTEGSLVGSEYELVYGFYPMKKGLGFMPFKVEGSAGPQDIAIEIKYNPELLDKKLYSELSAELRNSVRHELEHLAQYRAEKGVRPGEDGIDQDTLPDVEYLTLDYEIPGHIQGLKTKAKAKKISLQQAIDDLFNSFEYDLDPEEEDFVRETWMGWLEKNMPGVSLTKIKEDFDQQDVEDLDNLADRELNPIDVVLTGRHFFDRLNDPRNTPEIDYLELEDFFTKLGDNRDEFIDFLNKYKSVVATDTETNINIPFMKIANKAIAKTIMRKRNFQTPNVKVELEEADPKKGTGKKPKGSGRRLYTDEDPKDTVGIKFSTRQDIVDTLNKTSFKNKPHARQSQVINLIHQRVRAAYGRSKKPEVKKRLKSALDYITKRKEASKAKTQRLKKQKTNEVLEGKKRIDYYLNYYTNVSPTIFDISKEKDSIKIKGFENSYPKGFDDVADINQVLPTKDLDENVTPNHHQKPTPFNSGYKELEEEFKPYLNPLTDYMAQELNLSPYPSIEYIEDDKENKANIFGKTAYYMPSEQKIVLFTLGRHPKDILRSYAHELVHHHQNLSDTLNHSNTTNTNEDGALEDIEREAYETGNILFRKWEDSLKND